MLNLLFEGMMFASFVTFVVVAVTLVQARERHADQPGNRPRSALFWIIISIVAFVVWLFLSFILNVGHNQGATGIRGLLGTIVVYGGPALYIYTGFQEYQLWRPRSSRPEIEKDDATD